MYKLLIMYRTFSSFSVRMALFRSAPTTRGGRPATKSREMRVGAIQMNGWVSKQMNVGR